MFCYQITGDARGEDFVCGDNIETFAYVEIEEGQFLELINCFAVPVEDTWPVKIENDTLSEGGYRVGVDIEPGEYKVKSTDEYSHYRITEDANGKEYVDGNTIEKSHYIEVREGEYLRLAKAEMKVN